MPAPTPKGDRDREMREAKFAARKPAKAAPEKMAIAQKALKASVSNALATTSNAKRHEKWRKANPELHRERARNSMQKLRETSMAKKPAPSKPSIAPKPATSKKGGKSGKGC